MRVVLPVRGRVTRPVLLLTGWLLLSGCSSELPTPYGDSRGRHGDDSINGMGTLRRSFAASGWQTKNVNRLSRRLRGDDAIVWTPKQSDQFNEQAALTWLAEWLRERPRTLVYVIADDGNEAEYWQQASDIAAADQRIEYRRRQARWLAEVMNRHVGWQGAIGHRIDRGWFQARRRWGQSPQWEVFVGDQLDVTLRESAQHHLPSRVPFMFTASEDEPSWEASHFDAENLRFEVLARGPDDLPLALRIVSAAGVDAEVAIGRSQLIVVAGGSLVTNFAIARHTAPGGAALVQCLLAACLDNAQSTKPMVGFLANDGPIPISQSEEELSEGAAGMALLTVWPLSLVTVHLALMGIILCMILFPAFGRPRRLAAAAHNDFGDHIQAVAVLLRRTAGQAYARERISDYFRRLRGENSGPWVIPEPATAPAPPSPTDERQPVDS